MHNDPRPPNPNQPVERNAVAHVAQTSRQFASWMFGETSVEDFEMIKLSITSSTVLESLALKHAEDVFVPECKDGPTQSGTHSRLDAWVMAKSWARPRVVGYEIKVSRADFVNDNKWQSYLPMCNELYFAAPKGIVKESELSAEVGLIELVGTSRLITRKKAQYRDITISEEVFRYILMCRAKIGNESGNYDPADQWRDWLKKKDDDRRLGYEVSKALREHVERVESENRELQARMKGYDEIKETLNRLGCGDGKNWCGAWGVEQRIRAIRALVPPDYKLSLKSLARSIEAIQREIEDMEKQQPA